MKKIIILTSLLMFAASSVFAATSLQVGTFADAGKSMRGIKTGGTLAATSPLIGKTSTGVGIGVLTSANGYSAVTQHKSGTKAFGSSYDSTSIYVKDATAPGTVVLDVPTATDSSNFTGAGWSSL